jgi:hypothetical protein
MYAVYSQFMDCPNSLRLEGEYECKDKALEVMNTLKPSRVSRDTDFGRLFVFVDDD